MEDGPDGSLDGLSGEFFSLELLVERVGQPRPGEWSHDFPAQKRGQSEHFMCQKLKVPHFGHVTCGVFWAVATKGAGEKQHAVMSHILCIVVHHHGPTENQNFATCTLS